MNWKCKCIVYIKYWNVMMFVYIYKIYLLHGYCERKCIFFFTLMVYCKHKEKKKKKININVVIIEKTGLFSKNKYIIIDRFYAISIRQIFLEFFFFLYCFYGGDGAVYTYTLFAKCGQWNIWICEPSYLNEIIVSIIIIWPGHQQ